MGSAISRLVQWGDTAPQATLPSRPYNRGTPAGHQTHDSTRTSESSVSQPHQTHEGGFSDNRAANKQATVAGGPSIFREVQNATVNGGQFIIYNVDEIDDLGDDQDMRRSQRLRRTLDFFSCVNFRAMQAENLAKWTQGTLEAFLTSTEFKHWLDGQRAILWGTGMPGAGKTVLASVVINYLDELATKDQTICVAFVYCRYTEPMAVRDILAALVRQLIEQYPAMLPSVELMYKKHQLQNTKPIQEELLGAIRHIFSQFKTAYLFIDGLDEALYDEQFDLLETLASTEANVLITSRPLARLEDALAQVTFFEIFAQEGDVQLLVAQHLRRSPDLRRILSTDDTRKQVIKKICESSRGMFLHASLMVEAVSRCTSLGSILKRVEELPPKLDALYEEAIERIKAQEPERAALAQLVLACVVYAFQPLTVQDLQHAVTGDPQVDWANETRLVPEVLLVSVCCGLITIEGEGQSTGKEEDEVKQALETWPPNTTSSIVRLVHYTALNALRRLVELDEVKSHKFLAERCVQRIMYCGILNHDKIFPSRVKYASALWPVGGIFTPALLEYAYRFWLLHANQAICSPETQFGGTPIGRHVPSLLRFLAEYTNFPESHDKGARSVDRVATILNLRAQAISFGGLASHVQT